MKNQSVVFLAAMEWNGSADIVKKRALLSINFFFLCRFPFNDAWRLHVRYNLHLYICLQ